MPVLLRGSVTFFAPPAPVFIGVDQEFTIDIDGETKIGIRSDAFAEGPEASAVCSSPGINCTFITTAVIFDTVAKFFPGGAAVSVEDAGFEVSVKLDEFHDKHGFLGFIAQLDGGLSYAYLDIRVGLSSAGDDWGVTIYGGVFESEAFTPIIATFTPITGNFNADGITDGADYVAWRAGLGERFEPEQYDIWRANFGNSWDSPMSGNSAGDIGASVPEPSGLLLALSLIGTTHVLERKRPHRGCLHESGRRVAEKR